MKLMSLCVCQVLILARWIANFLIQISTRGHTQFSDEEHSGLLVTNP
jgi:hypothetical protein